MNFIDINNKADDGGYLIPDNKSKAIKEIALKATESFGYVIPPKADKDLRDGKISWSEFKQIVGMP